MDKQEENDRIVFEGFCYKANSEAYQMGSLCVEEFYSEELNDREKIKKASLKITELTNEINLLNRIDYFIYRYDIDYLFNIFKTSGYLNNQQELNNLQHALILGEKFTQLNYILIGNSHDKETPKGKDHKYLPKGTPSLTKEESEVHESLYKIHKIIPLVISLSGLYLLTKLLCCHNWHEMKEPIFLACKTTEFKAMVILCRAFNPDLRFVNIERYGLVISKFGNPISARDISSTSIKKMDTWPTFEKYLCLNKKKH